MFDLNEKDAIRSYKYNGGDRSLLYQQLLSPLAEWSVINFVPLSIAPNAITFLALLLTAVCALVGFSMDNSLSGECPPWYCAYTAASFFAYQTLDNMDGKQARRTKSSSALGMIFDHSCDAINAVVSSIAVAKVMGMGWSPKILMFYMYGYCPFYFQTWLEYISGSMWLPIFNGPSEGIFMIIGLCGVSAIQGSHWWYEVTIFFVVYIVCVMLLIAYIYNIKHIKCHNINICLRN